MDTGKVTSKYYVMFHIIPLVLRLRKVKDIKSVPKLVAQSCFEYVKSCCFLSFLVGLLRAGLCANWNQSPENILSFGTFYLIQRGILPSQVLCRPLAFFSRTPPGELR